MRRFLVTITAALACTAFATDLPAVNDSKGTIVGAVEGLLKDPMSVSQYLPGYGFHIATYALGTNLTMDAAVSGLSQVLPALVGTLRGLEPGEWVSVSYATDEHEVVVRVKTGDTKALEVFVDGVKRP